MSEIISITSADGSGTFSAYVARPKGGDNPRAAIVVIQEIFGVNAGIRQKCASLADQGYLAIAPDLFWRLKPNITLDPDSPDQMAEALDWMGQFNQDLGVADIAATLQAARSLTGGKKVGVVGYCLGGRLAFMAAARTDTDASVGYYAVAVDALLGEKDAITAPTLLHIAGDDGFVPPQTQAAMHEGLDNHPLVTLFDYPGLNHGFATETGMRRNDEAAQVADARTAAFFAEHLG